MQRDSGRASSRSHAGAVVRAKARTVTAPNFVLDNPSPTPCGRRRPRSHARELFRGSAALRRCTAEGFSLRPAFRRLAALIAKATT